MVRHGCLATIGMTELPVRSSLTNLYETKSFQNAHGFPGFQNGQGSHDALHRYGLCADELGFQVWFPILQKHLNYFAEVLAQFLKSRALGMGAREPRHVADVELRVRASLDHCGKLSHSNNLSQGWVRD